MCPKCEGLLVSDIAIAESQWITTIRCVNCGFVKYNKEARSYANKTKDRRTIRVGELELYRSRSRGAECNSNSL